MTRSQKVALSIPFALSLAFAGAVTAQQTPTPPPPTGGQPAIPTQAAPPDANGVPSFQDVDANHDGKITRSEIPKDVEALKQLRAHFREADHDGNGSLTADEYTAYTSNVRSSGM